MINNQLTLAHQPCIDFWQYRCQLGCSGSYYVRARTTVGLDSIGDNVTVVGLLC